MSIGIVHSKLDVADAKAIRIAARKGAQAAVAPVVQQKTILRDLAPFDISAVAAGSANQYAVLSNKAALVAGTWDVNDLGYTRVAQYQAIVVYGYEHLVAAPLITCIRFTLGPAQVAFFHVGPATEDKVARILYFDPPIIFRPQQQFGVDLLATGAVAANAETYRLLGAVAEAEGQVVISQESDLV